MRRWIQFKDRYVESDYLFPVKHSGAHVEVSTFETNFKKYLRRAGINEKITPHCLRNNFAKRYFYRNGKKGQHCMRCNCSLEAKLGQYGLYIQCCGAQKHRYKLDEI